jgi:hypothetical protein
LQQHADDAQQAFSASSMLMLQHALLALEKLYSLWEKATAKPPYESFISALTVGMNKLNTYYERSTDSDVHIMAMGELLFLIPLQFADHCALLLQCLIPPGSWHISTSTGPQTSLLM